MTPLTPLFLLADDFFDRGIPDEPNLRILARAILHDLRRAQRVAAMHDRGLVDEAGQEGRFLHRGVAAADHDRILVLEECAVAGGACAHAVAHQALFRFDSEQLGGRAGRDDHRLGLDHLVVDDQLERSLAEAHLGHRAAHEARAEARHLAPEHVHHLGALDAVLEAGIVLDLGGDGELAAGFVPLDQQRTQIGARRVERRGQSGGTGAENYDLVDFVSHMNRLRIGLRCLVEPGIKSLLYMREAVNIAGVTPAPSDF